MLDEDGVYRLAIAVIKLAVEDYRIYRRAYATELSRIEQRILKDKMRHIERFLLSAYGQMLSFGNGEKIVERLTTEKVYDRKRL